MQNKLKWQNCYCYHFARDTICNLKDLCRLWTEIFKLIFLMFLMLRLRSYNRIVESIWVISEGIKKLIFSKRLCFMWLLWKTRYLHANRSTLTTICIKFVVVQILLVSFVDTFYDAHGRTVRDKNVVKNLCKTPICHQMSTLGGYFFIKPKSTC